MKCLIVTALLIFSASSFADGILVMNSKQLKKFTYELVGPAPEEGSCTYHAKFYKKTFTGFESEMNIIQAPCDLHLENLDSKKLVVEIGGVYAPPNPTHVLKVFLDDKLLWQKEQ